MTKRELRVVVVVSKSTLNSLIKLVYRKEVDGVVEDIGFVETPESVVKRKRRKHTWRTEDVRTCSVCGFNAVNGTGLSSHVRSKHKIK